MTHYTRFQDLMPMPPTAHQVPLPPSQPNTEAELYQLACQLVGRSFDALAQEAGIEVPADLKRDKGWVGQLLEWHLGAQAGSKPEPDFAHLGIELKSIPIGYNGRPLETTFVSVAPLTGMQGVTWENSHVRHKLARVLWVPIEGERDIPLAKRRVGWPILWSPNADQAQALKQDWEELMEFIMMGKSDEVTAKHGEVMQLRPKAANKSARTQAYDKQGQPAQSMPRGFYLRTQFTETILKAHLGLSE